jgi:hypothetical protein
LQKGRRREPAAVFETREVAMAIEIEVADQIGMSAVTGVLQGTVIVRFDGPIETMQITVLFKDCGSRKANSAAAIAAAKRLAFRLTQEPV